MKIVSKIQEFILRMSIGAGCEWVWRRLAERDGVSGFGVLYQWWEPRHDVALSRPFRIIWNYSCRWNHRWRLFPKFKNLFWECRLGWDVNGFGDVWLRDGVSIDVLYQWWEPRHDVALSRPFRIIWNYSCHWVEIIDEDCFQNSRIYFENDWGGMWMGLATFGWEMVWALMFTTNDENRGMMWHYPILFE